MVPSMVGGILKREDYIRTYPYMQAYSVIYKLMLRAFQRPKSRLSELPNKALSFFRQRQGFKAHSAVIEENILFISCNHMYVHIHGYKTHPYALSHTACPPNLRPKSSLECYESASTVSATKARPRRMGSAG